MHPACYCAGRARPRALLLPLDPYGHGLLHALPPDACRIRGHGKRKSWNFIHEKMSYDTFFTMKRLIERSRSVGEVLRWVTQNPGKVSASHYPIALHKLGQLLQQQQGPAALNGESRRPGPVLEQPEFQTLCQAIISGCSKFDNFSIVNCLYAAAALGEWPGHGAAPRASCGSAGFCALGVWSRATSVLSVNLNPSCSVRVAPGRAAQLCLGLQKSGPPGSCPET